MGTEELELHNLGKVIQTSQGSRMVEGIYPLSLADGRQNAGFNDEAWKEGKARLPGTMENEHTAQANQNKNLSGTPGS